MFALLLGAAVVAAFDHTSAPASAQPIAPIAFANSNQQNFSFDTEPINGIPQINADLLCPMTPTGSVNLTSATFNFRFELAWSHACASEETTFTVTAATAAGWIGVGLNDKAALGNERMSGAEFFIFATDAQAPLNAQLAASAENAQPEAVSVSAFVGAPTVQYRSGVLTATFTRKWGAVDAQHVSLAAADGLFVLAARGSSAGYGSQHPTSARRVLPAKVALFKVGAGSTPLPPPPPPAPTPAPPAMSPCDVAGKVALNNSVLITFGNKQEVTVGWSIACAAKTIEFKVSGKSNGWIAMGLHTVAASMDGLDTYQFTIDAAGGTGTVRYGKAEGTDVTEESTAPAKSAVRTGDTMTVSFVRPLKGDAKFLDLEFGKRVFIYASVRNATADVTLPHLSSSRLWTARSLELFCDKPTDKCDPAVQGGTPAPATTKATTKAPTGAAVNGTDPCAADPMSSFSNELKLPLGSSQVTLGYTVSCANKTIAFNVTGTTKGWLAIGFNENGRMPNTDTYQMGIKDGKFVVRNGFADGRDIVEDEVLTDVSGQLVGDQLSGRFTRKLVATRASDRTLSFQQPWFIMVAQADGADFTGIHDLKSATVKAEQLFTTTVSTIEAPSKTGGVMQLVHGILMLLAWVALSTPGMFIARYLKDLGRPWYLLHRAMLNIVLIFTLVGFAIITAERAIAQANYVNPHAYLGIIVTILVIVQVILGVLANRLWSPSRPGTPAFPDMIHWWLGRSLLVLGAANCGWGLYIYGSNSFNAGFIIYIIFIVLLIAFVIAGQVVIGAVHHNADSETGPGKKELMPRWRNLTFVVIVIGVIVAIASAVVAGVGAQQL